MFEKLQERLQQTVKQLRGQGRLTEDNIRHALREVRMALLEADVALPVAKAFIEQVKEKAVGQEVLRNLNPGEAVIKVVHDELVAVMGGRNESLDLAVRPPAVVLLAGLQGAGKTTTAAKLARFLKERERKRVLLASADVYRPAAVEQLRRLAAEVGVDFVEHEADADPVAIAAAALAQARNTAAEVLVLDTAGRLHVDEQMMGELKAIHAAVAPVETLFVVDSMTGQDAVNSAAAFDRALALTGVILTKADGDARGGAALSIRHVIGKPIKFIGVGEKSDALEPFHPDRLASRILGMGDVLTLIEDAQRQLDTDKAARVAEKVTRGKGFDLEDLRDQLLQVEKMGGMAGILDRLPAMGGAAGGALQRGGADTRRMVASRRSCAVRASGASPTARAPRSRTSTACSSSLCRCRK
jgi:signal recognition particle subunit SRP54